MEKGTLMLRYFGMFLALLICSCHGTASLEKLPSVETPLAVDAFSMTFHKQLGSCQSLPITHRFLRFDVGILERTNDDIFFGSLDVFLNETDSTYEALYREFPGLSNSDNSTIYSQTLQGSFEILKANETQPNDRMILENIGTVDPTIFVQRVQFILKLDNSIHRNILQNEVLGRVMQSFSALRPNTCP